MTTNESFFFRDKTPFEHFRDTILPALLPARAEQQRIRIWCAAASTGQEPYSLAMCLKEFGAELAGWQIEILATDISQEVLEKAKAGHLQPVRGAARPADPVAGQVFHPSRRAWQITPISAPWCSSASQPAQDFSARAIRRGVLPQRADLFRPGDQDRRVRAARQDGGVRRLCCSAPPNPWSGISEAFKPYPDRRGPAECRAHRARRTTASLEGGRLGALSDTTAFSSEELSGSLEENASKKMPKESHAAGIATCCP